MKKLIVSLTLLAISVLVAHAQPTKSRIDQIKAAKVGFITQKLSLTVEEAQQFWPVYNAFDEEKAKLRAQMVAIKSDSGDVANMSDADASKALDRLMQIRKLEYELELKYNAEFKKVLPARKILLLYQAERKFNQHLLQEMQSRQNGSRGAADKTKPGLRN